MKTAPKLEKFVPLELSKCQTVGQILEAMSKTPVGSGMLGRLAVDLRRLIAQGEKPLVVLDGAPSRPLVKLVEQMKKYGWISDLITFYHYNVEGLRRGHKAVLFLGRFSDQDELGLDYEDKTRKFFVNQWGFAIPGHIQDGHFHDVVVADPCFVLPLLCAALEEWFEGKPWAVDDKLISWLEKCGGTGEEFARGTRVLKAMTEDPDCTVVFTATGVLTVAQMSPIVCDLIDAWKINVIITTGALLGHGLVWSLDLHHYRHDPNFNDEVLAANKLNRITDAIEPEINLDHVEEVISTVLSSLPEGIVLSSSALNRLIGEHLRSHFKDQRGILKSAAEKDVPVIIPAFYDSELGNDVITHNWRRRREGKNPILMNLEKDTERLVEILTMAKRRGIFTLGGGPPRNTPQNVPPLVEILNNRLGLNMPVPMYQYACRVCPDPIWLGHLGGCTYKEGISWRKMDPNGQFAEVHMDALHAFPFLAKYVLS